MKNKFFHKGFYLDTLGRIKGFALFTIILSIATSAMSGFSLLALYDNSLTTGGTVEISIKSLFDIVIFAGIIATVFVPVLTFVAFHHLYKRNESDFFETVPVRREAMALSGILAVMTVFAVSVVGALVTYLLVSIPCIGNYYVIDVASLMLELLASILAALIGAALTLLAISITGTLSSGIATFISIALTPRLIMSIVLLFLESSNDTLVSGKIIPFFNGNMNIHYALIFSSFSAQETVWNYVYSAVLGIVVLVLAVRLFKARGSEAISHSYTNHISRHIISILITTVISAFAIVCLSVDDMELMGIIFLAGALVTFAIYEKAACGKGNKNRGGLIAFIVLIVVSSIYGVSLSAMENHFADYSPEPEEIEYISVVSTKSGSGLLDDLFFDNTYLDYENYVEMRAESIEITDREVAKIISAAIKEKDDNSEQEKQAITVKIKSGITSHYRKVYLCTEDYSYIRECLAKHDEYNKIWLNIDEGARYPYVYYGGYRINSNMMGEVIGTMKAEIAEKGISMYQDAAYIEYPLCKISYNIYHDGEEYVVGLPVYSYMEKTIEKLEQARKKVAELELESLYSVLEQIDNGAFPAYIYVSCYVENSYYFADVYTTDNDVDIKEFISGLALLPSSDPQNDYKNYVSISISNENLLGDSYYYTFAVDSDITPDELKEFFEKYE